jgi:4-carboxymuconolactone decarboxylase
MPRETSSPKSQAGRQVRREVLGADYVDRRAATAWPFAKPYVELLEEYCWGTIWADPGLSRRDRSLLTLGMLIASHRNDELVVHLGGALNNGLTPEELRAACIQMGVYCGVPAGMEALRALRRVLEERGIEVAGEQSA